MSAANGTGRPERASGSPRGQNQSAQPKDPSPACRSFGRTALPDDAREAFAARGRQVIRAVLPDPGYRAEFGDGRDGESSVSRKPWPDFPDNILQDKPTFIRVGRGRRSSARRTRGQERASCTISRMTGRRLARLPSYSQRYPAHRGHRPLREPIDRLADENGAFSAGGAYIRYNPLSPPSTRCCTENR